jgi:colanic acid/amylovoran biosynthesis glycosyltransferase
LAICYCATFLKPEMQHIYRQLSAIKQYEVEVVTQKQEGDFPFPRVTVIPRGSGRWLRRVVYKQMLGRPMPLSGGEVSAIRKHLEDARPAVVHVIFGNTAVQLLPVLGDAQRVCPVVVSFHGADVLVELDRAPYRAAMVEMLGRVDLVLARSQSLAQALVAAGCPAEKIRINSTGIPLASFPFRARDWPTDGRWQLAQSSRLIEKKGLPVTLRAFARFREKWPLARLLIAGEGPMESALRQLAADLGIAGSVEFAGFLGQEALRQRLDGAHLFVHPSERGPDGNQEGVPNAILEAMALGLPVLATRHGGIPEAIQHGVSGWLVPERDVAALGEGLLALADDPALLKTMAEAGARVVAEHFESRAQAAKLEGYYAEAIEEAWIS